ncbi:MAG: hypothetical protein WB998_01730 [Solirubrobacteraceae bacterium]
MRHFVRGIRTRGRRLSVTAVAAGSIAVLAATGSAFAFQPLPAGTQLNDDPLAGIDGTLSISGQAPTNASIVGGALTAGKVAEPWAVFRQPTAAGGHDQTFVRSFTEGTWSTQGRGTVGGRSSASSIYSGSLNFDQAQDAEAPAIDFAGAGRTIPWASWYEDTSGAGFAANNVFASRFDDVGDANQGRWIFSGQNRGTGGASVPAPSLNLHTDEDAENPSVAGGSAVDATKPSPWVAWQETSTASGHPDQIFVERSEGPGLANCDSVTPAGEVLGGHVPAIGGVCWQQTGIARFGTPTRDPSLNVDPTRNGAEPDIAFAGSQNGVQDGVPWVVWYETGAGTAGLHSNEMVFAAQGVSDGEAAHGGFHWVAVGSQLNATLDTTGTNGFGGCDQSAANEARCSLNSDPAASAENPRVAAGTMSPGVPTVPWVAWDEQVANVSQVFVSRLVGTGANAHFEIANGGAPISTGANDSTRPDIAFSGNTPYVSWREDVGGAVVKAFTGHFVNAASPTFVLDGDEVTLTPTAQADVREPISSSCTANPLDADGSACEGGALGTPFFLFTAGTTPLSLFADAYQPDPPVTEGASAVGSSSASIGATVNQHGTPTSVFFQYGPTTAYGASTSVQKFGAESAPRPFSAQLSGLAAATTIHYRAVASGDFGTFYGADQTLTTMTITAASTGPPGVLSHPPGVILGIATASKPTASGTSARIRVSCTGPASATCKVTLRLTVTESFQGHRLVAVSANARKTHRLLVVGSASVLLESGHAQIVRIGLNRAGKRLLASRHRLKATLRVTVASSSATPTSIVTRVVTFK